MNLPNIYDVEKFIDAPVHMANLIHEAEGIYVVDVETEDAAKRAHLYLSLLLPVKSSHTRQVKLWHDGKPKDEGVRLVLILDMDALRLLTS